MFSCVDRNLRRVAVWPRWYSPSRRFIASIGVTTVWPYLDGVSRGLVVVFSIMAVLSIKNGTWMESHRKIRRAQRETRRETLREAKRAVWG